MNQEQLTKVLSLINDARASLSFPPLSGIPKGNRGSSCCPVARALGCRVWVGRGGVYFLDEPLAAHAAKAWRTNGNNGIASFPNELMKFVSWFDNGYLPQFEE